MAAGRSLNVPRICFVNKMDRVGADFGRTIEMIIERLNAKPVVLQLPIGSEAAFTGVIDLITNQAWHFTGERDDAPSAIEVPNTWSRPSTKPAKS